MGRKSEPEREKQSKASRQEKETEQTQQKNPVSDEDIPTESREQAIEEIREAAEKSGYAKQVQEETRKNERNK